MRKIVQRRNNPVGAVLFDGCNIKEILEFVDKDCIEIMKQSPNDPGFEKLFISPHKGGMKRNISPGTWITFEDHEYRFYSKEEFEIKFTEKIETFSSDSEFINCIKIIPVKAKRVDDDHYTIMDNTGFTSNITSEEFKDKYMDLTPVIKEN